eukprot:5857076-Pleurochrysis_carterae.AAC.2
MLVAPESVPKLQKMLLVEYSRGKLIGEWSRHPARRKCVLMYTSSPLAMARAETGTQSRAAG